MASISSSFRSKFCSNLDYQFSISTTCNRQVVEIRCHPDSFSEAYDVFYSNYYTSVWKRTKNWVVNGFSAISLGIVGIYTAIQLRDQGFAKYLKGKINSVTGHDKAKLRHIIEDTHLRVKQMQGTQGTQVPFRSMLGLFDFMKRHPSEKSFKIAIVGTRGSGEVGGVCVGKSTMLKRHVHGEFNENYDPTTSVQTFNVKFNTNCGKINFRCFDLPGDEQFHGVDADASLIVFDVTDASSFNNVVGWYTSLSHLVPSIPIALCGNKVDSVPSFFVPLVSWQQATRYAALSDASFHILSVRTGHGIDEPFLNIATALIGKPITLIKDPLDA